MSLFRDNHEPGLIKVRISLIWFFWAWTVEYKGVKFLDRGGFATTQLKAIRKAQKAVKAIGQYQKKMGIVDPEEEVVEM